MRAKLPHSSIRFGLCCMFRDQPIKFVTTTATAIGRMRRPDALAKLSRLCMEHADALLAALQFCAENGTDCQGLRLTACLNYCPPLDLVKG